MKITALLNNEDGSIIILTLIFLVLLTVMGMSATSTSTIEVQIAGNGARFKQNLYLAEAAAMEAIQRMEDAGSSNLVMDDAAAFSWLNDDLGDITNPSTQIPSTLTSSVSDPVTGGQPRFAAVSRGVTGAASLGMTASSQLYTFDVYGIYDADGLSQVVVGYKKRF